MKILCLNLYLHFRVCRYLSNHVSACHLLFDMYLYFNFTDLLNAWKKGALQNASISNTLLESGFAVFRRKKACLALKSRLHTIEAKPQIMYHPLKQNLCENELRKSICVMKQIKINSIKFVFCIMKQYEILGTFS